MNGTDGHRWIAHLDLDAFYATVEEVINPTLKGLPVIIVMGEDTLNRGAVATASYAARRFGVHSAMPVTQARKLCPDAVYLPVRHDLYKAFSKSVMELLTEETALLEQVSIDEAYLDLSTSVDPLVITRRLQTRIVHEIGLSASVGLATNKLVAKMASGYQKPGGLTVVPPGEEATFLAPNPVGKLFGIGPKGAARMQALGINTIGDLAQADLELLQVHFGPNLGQELRDHAGGLDNRPVITQREAKSLSSERTLFENTADRRKLWQYIQEMANSLEEQLQRRSLLARTVAIKLRLYDWKLVTRAETLLTPTDNARMIAASAGRLMRRHWRRGTPLRLLGVRVSNFVSADAPLQLELNLPTPTPTELNEG